MLQVVGIECLDIRYLGYPEQIMLILEQSIIGKKLFREKNVSMNNAH